MEIDVSQDQGRVPVTVFHLKGNLNSDEPLRSRAKEAFDSGARDLLLDLSDVSYISSAGLRALNYVFNLFNSSEEQGPGDRRAVQKAIAAGTYKCPHLKLLRPSKNAMKVLNLAGYDMFLDIYKNRAKAIASF